MSSSRLRGRAEASAVLSRRLPRELSPRGRRGVRAPFMVAPAHHEFGLSPEEIVRTAAGTGRLATDLVDAFIHSRLALFDSVEFADDGSVVALRPTHLPWTIWLRKFDLPEAVWKLVGRGPQLTWIGGEAANARTAVDEAEVADDAA